MKTWRHFKLAEFDCRCGCQVNKIQEDFVDLLEELRSRVGFPLVVTSGYRCPEHNEKVSTTGKAGPHTTGRAADIAVERGRALTVLRHAVWMNFTGIGLNQKGSSRFIHLDDLVNDARPNIWTY